MTRGTTPKMGLFVCALLLSLASSAGSEQVKKSRLFDGKTFEGWEGDVQKTFRIQDNAVVGGSLSAKVPQNEFLCTRKS